VHDAVEADPPRLLLASTSRHRRALLERLRVPFETAAPEFEETFLPGEPPVERARRLAEGKARAAGERLSGRRTLVIGSDQVASLEGEVLSKPGTRERAVAQLLRARGRTLEFHTGVAVLDTASGRTHVHVEPFRARLRPLEEARIARYVDLERPLDAAGAFYSEGLGIVLFEALEGRDPTALVGLPLVALVDLLAEAGVAVLDLAR
jgi:septum formation protein